MGLKSQLTQASCTAVMALEKRFAPKILVKRVDCRSNAQIIFRNGSLGLDPKKDEVLLGTLLDHEAAFLLALTQSFVFLTLWLFSDVSGLL